ncbi:hypothetical protein C0J52_08705 [Blattella germanica]|nr:hypothetical protein C0J52_08705 [Blattella germanica]
MQCEMGQIQRERNLLEEQKKMIKSPLTISTGAASQGTYDTSCNAQLREIREKYSRLEDDFKNKVTECASLRNDNIQLKQIADAARKAQEAAEAAAQQYEEKYKTNEVQTKVGSQTQMIEQEQQLIIARQRYREAQDELDDLRTIVHDQTVQLEEYRNKYLQAQEQVEEQRRNIELLEMDNARINEQAQFQEKMQELSPLPDLLSATQMKLKECQQLKAVADHNLELMARDLQEAKEEVKSNLARSEEAAAQNMIRFQEKQHEITQLTSQLETIREESARQVSRTKDRAEAMRRSLQNQISDIERELAQSRASARTAQKERDEIRQRMQFQINNLTDNFDQAQLRIRSLQSHVDYLKSSYNEMCIPDKPSLMSDVNSDACGCNF